MTGNGFVRVKLLQVELLPSNGTPQGSNGSSGSPQGCPGSTAGSNPPGAATKHDIVDPFCVVNLKEAEEIPGE